MADLPIVGAQITALDIPRHRDWLFEKNRDLELPEYSMNDLLRKPQPMIDLAKKYLDGFQGRLGIHGPFSGFELDVKDKVIRPVVQDLLMQTLACAEALSARQIVLHSPFDLWSVTNNAKGPHELEGHISAIADTLAPMLKRAEDTGVMVVIENIKDVDPGHRQAVLDAAASPALRLSVDIGHAYWAEKNCDAPSADGFITAAGEALGHVHLQDSDGIADRHWALGEGNLPMAPVFEALAKIESQPHLIVEIKEFDKIEQSVAHLESLGLAQ